MKRLYILAGANGSGKSTISRVLLPDQGLVYVNPDDIAKELNPESPAASKIEAGKEALRRINAFLDAGESFAIESTLSGLVYVKVLKKARELGYSTLIAYAFVDSPDVCIARIQARVRAGGHFIPPEDVRRRYSRSKRNFLETYSGLVDEWMLYYNGGAVGQLVAECGSDGRVHVLSDEMFAKFKEGL